MPAQREHGIRAPSAPPPVVAIAVVSWNTRALLDACLASMRADADAGLAEVWVVDNGSSDGSPELVAEHHPWAQLVRPGENLGFGRAVNRVAAATTAPWIAAANADIALTPGALATLLGAGERDPGAGAVAPRLLLPDGSVQPSVQPFPTLGHTVLEVLRAARISDRVARRLYVRGHWDPDRRATVPWATGAFLLLRRTAFEQVGRFDESQWLYGEDLDLCWRLGRAGWRIRYEPCARVRHEEHAAALQAFGERFPETWLRATYAWKARRYGIAATWAAAGLRLVDARMRVAVLVALARRSPQRFEPRLLRARRDLYAARFGLRPRRDLLRSR